MGLFTDVFNVNTIYDTLFLNITTVSEYPDFETLKQKNENLSKQWEKFSLKTFWNINVEDSYKKNAPYHPEFGKIVVISYGEIFLDGDGKLRRSIKQITNPDEGEILITFFKILNDISSNAAQSSPQYNKILFGYDIRSTMIPFLIKRFLYHRESITKETPFPSILKTSLDSKPWEASTIIDCLDIWKFNGVGRVAMETISEFLGLKKNIPLLSTDEISQHYWNNYEKDIEESQAVITKQSATNVNLLIQYMNEIRKHMI
jgi:hypothetical protein